MDKRLKTIFAASSGILLLTLSGCATFTKDGPKGPKQLTAQERALLLQVEREELRKDIALKSTLIAWESLTSDGDKAAHLMGLLMISKTLAPKERASLDNLLLNYGIKDENELKNSIAKYEMRMAVAAVTSANDNGGGKSDIRSHAFVLDLYDGIRRLSVYKDEPSYDEKILPAAQNFIEAELKKAGLSIIELEETVNITVSGSPVCKKTASKWVLDCR